MGTQHTCALTTTSAMKCWGSNGAGQLGDGMTTNKSAPVPVAGTGPNPAAIKAGSADTCVAFTSKPVQCLGRNDTYQLGPMQSTQTWTRYIAAIGGGLAATHTNTGQTRYQLTNIRGDVVAEADDSGLQQTAPVDEFGVPEDGQLPTGTRYAFQGTHQREALTPGGTIAMGVRLYVPQAGRFLQVDPVLGGTDNTYEYPSDPVNSWDLSGKSLSCGAGGDIWPPSVNVHCTFRYAMNRRKTKKVISFLNDVIEGVSTDGTALCAILALGTEGTAGAVCAAVSALTMKYAYSFRKKFRNALKKSGNRGTVFKAKGTIQAGSGMGAHFRAWVYPCYSCKNGKKK